jgi:threonine aldolase
MNYIDLRSDTVTQPTDEMRKAMAEAEVGDDVYEEDPTVSALQRKSAEILGKEAALLVPSGTMGNQICVMTHTRKGDEIILGENSHIFYYEVGGLAALSGVQARTIKENKGILDASMVEECIRDENIHFPKTSLICMENTHNRAGGTIVPIDKMKAVFDVAKCRGISVHLDGARIFNASIGLGVPVMELAKYADSVMFCLSKGLAAPVGSVICGTTDFIKRARKNRKLLGGGMRQAGIIAAAGIVALEEMVCRLAEDHENAKALGEGLAGLQGVNLDIGTVQTNMVALDVRDTGADAAKFAGMLYSHGVRVSIMGSHTVRFVTHKDIKAGDIPLTVKAVKQVIQELRS